MSVVRSLPYYHAKNNYAYLSSQYSWYAVSPEEEKRVGPLQGELLANHAVEALQNASKKQEEPFFIAVVRAMFCTASVDM